MTDGLGVEDLLNRRLLTLACQMGRKEGSEVVKASWETLLELDWRHLMRPWESAGVTSAKETEEKEEIRVKRNKKKNVAEEKEELAVSC